MKLTTDHSASSYGVPIFVDENNNPLDYADGLKRLRKEKGWSTSELGEMLGVSKSTIDNWEQGRRMVSKTALLLLTHLI